MEDRKSPELSDWGMWLIHKVFHPFITAVVPLFIFLLMLFLIIYAFREDLHQGIRSFASVLLPLILVTYIFMFQKELLGALGRIPPPLSFVGTLIIGFLIMWMINRFAYSSLVPISELVLSGSFSTLLFSYVGFQTNKMLSYYYGTFSGFLIYIIFFGFPL